MPSFGSTVFQDMSISAVVRPSALSAAKLDSDQAVPLLSHLSCVDHSGVADVAAGVAAPALKNGAVTSAAITARTPTTAAGSGILDLFLNFIELLPSVLGQ